MNEKINLIRPTSQLKEEALAYRKEHFNYGELIINGSELLDKIDDYEKWLENVTLNSCAKTVSSHWVLTDTFFAVRESDQKIVGIVDLRYELNDFLKDLGNCGYSIRPTERNKGYATEILSQICQKAKNYGLNHLQLSVEKDNVASLKVILKNGGHYTRSFLLDGQTIDVYIIDL